MPLIKWLRNLRSILPQNRRGISGRTSSIPLSQRRFFPQLEILEDRAVPATFHVTTTLDGVVGSLREAIIAANATPGENTVVLPAGNYALTLAGTGEDECLTGDLDITNHLRIVGAGASNTIIDGYDLDRVFQIMNGKHVSISGVTIQGGHSSYGYIGGGGGGIYVASSTLHISNSTITGNSADFGGGIFARNANLTIDQSSISGNSATNDGGGIEIAEYSTLLVRDSTISGNSAFDGGGIFAIDSNQTLVHSIISSNSVNRSGGGVRVEDRLAIPNYSTLTLMESTIAGNSAFNGGGIYGGVDVNLILSRSQVSDNSASFGGGITATASNLTITQSTISRNSGLYNGGGIYAGYRPGFSGGVTLTISHSTISSNSSEYGAGMLVGGRPVAPSEVVISHSTIANNAGWVIGGGIMAVGCSLEIDHCTITGNAASDGGGISADNGNLKLDHCIISGNLAYRGGGVFLISVASPVEIDHCSISNNTAVEGGGVYASDCLVEIDHSTLNELLGGGIFSDQGTFHLKASWEDGIYYKDQHFYF